MKKIKIKRFIQEPSHCVIAAISTVVNFYNPEIDYKFVKTIALKEVVDDTSFGCDSGEMGLLLNCVGFNDVKLVTSNVYIFDYKWARLKRKALVERLKESKGKINKEYRSTSNSLYKWLKRYEYNNEVIVDYNFGKYIRNFLDRQKPVIVSFNWNMFFKYPKFREKYTSQIEDPIKGEIDEHAVVVYGYNKRGVYVCDSHHDYYKYKLKKYRKGFYFISWENLMSIIGMGDVFLPNNYQTI